jgi:hypothetical protein
VFTGSLMPRSRHALRAASGRSPARRAAWRVPEKPVPPGRSVDSHSNVVPRMTPRLMRTQPIPSGPMEDLEAETILQHPAVVVAGAQSPWVRRRKLKLADLADEKWILPPPATPESERVASDFRSQGLRPSRARVTTLSHARSATETNGRFLSAWLLLTRASPETLSGSRPRGTRATHPRATLLSTYRRRG